ncbi:MAG: hypothetical protein H7248_04200 [Microbacteriaceae bacterium]|nr:hypothetical protein [Microbacteriaceae bacterium]
MGIGSGIFFVVVGAILAFALNVQLSWVDLHLVGYLLMAAGAVITIISLALVARKRQSSSVTSTSVDPSNGRQVTRNDRSDTV